MGRYVREVLPDYAASLLKALREEGREDLAKQVDSLEIVALCDCGRRGCASFYTIDPDELDRRDGQVEIFGGHLVTIAAGRIVFVDLLALNDTNEERVRRAFLEP